MSKSYFKSEIIEVKQLSERVKTFSLRPEVPFDYNAGQYIKVKTEVGKADYTLISFPDKSSILEIAVDAHPKSTVGTHLHGLESGSNLEMKGPYGRFTVRPSDRPLVFISYTIGITPVLSNLRHLYNLEFPNEVRCYQIVPDGFENIFEEEIQKMKEVLNLDYKVIDTSIVKDKKLRKGKIKSKFLKEWFGDVVNGEFYLAGSKKVVKKVTKKLEKIGVDKRDIHLEKF